MQRARSREEIGQIHSTVFVRPPSLEDIAAWEVLLLGGDVMSIGDWTNGEVTPYVLVKYPAED